MNKYVDYKFVFSKRLLVVMWLFVLGMSKNDNIYYNLYLVYMSLSFMLVPLNIE